MVEKYFFHRIQEENGTLSKGIEVHDTLDAAVLSFWGRMKLAYNSSSAIKYMSCKITDGTGNTVAPYDMTWIGNEEDNDLYFLHYIRKDGENFTKGIDNYDSFDAARVAFATQMEYGYGNTKHPNVEFVSCEITAQNGMVMTPFDKTWVKPEPEPEPEAEG